MVTITDVGVGTLAARAGIQPGDVLISVNSHEIRDVLDYRFYIAETHLTLTVHRGPELFDVTIRKGVYDDIGLYFETPLMDKKHSCENKCMFCFIDQLPEGLRESLYFKDDDSRLSFLHGNYITLTNLHKRDIERILEMHISPVNVSVHTTNPALRVRMMKNKRAGEVLSYIGDLARGGITLHGQIVLCRGVNDGEELGRTMRDLAAYYPAMESVSVVPAGLTAYRDGLYPLEPFTPEETAEIIKQVTAFGDECEKKYGARIFWCADEMYVRSGTPLPPYEFWGEFSQIENGVGMLSSFEYEFDAALRCLTDEERAIKRTVSVATGEASYAFMCRLAEKLKAVCPYVDCRVYCVKNHFFGGHVTVTGLLTGKDIMEQLSGKVLGEELILSRTTLRAEGDLFLCNSTPADVSDVLGVPITFADNDGGAFLDAILGIGGDL